MIEQAMQGRHRTRLGSIDSFDSAITINGIGDRPEMKQRDERSNPRFKTKKNKHSKNTEHAPSDETLDGELTDEFSALIGAVVVEWSRLDHVIQTVIWKLLNLDFDIGRLVTSQNDISENISMLRAIFQQKLRPDEICDGILARLNRLQPLMEARNLVVHGLWSVRGSDGLPGVMVLRKKTPGKVLWEGFSRIYMESLVEEIKSECQVWANLAASPSTSSEKSGQ